MNQFNDIAKQYPAHAAIGSALSTTTGYIMWSKSIPLKDKMKTSSTNKRMIPALMKTFGKSLVGCGIAGVAILGASLIVK